MSAWLAISLAAALAHGPTAAAGTKDAPAFQVIVNAENPATTLDAATLAMMFLGNAKRWPDGSLVLPVDQSMFSPVRRAFTGAVLGRELSMIRVYWEYQISSGGVTPPPVRSSDGAAIAYVATNPGAIAYVSGSALLPAKVKPLQIEP